ncbi:MAG: tRNA pseudouridine(55) synthase TruB, partial [Paracoccaceae bacterium]
PDPDHAELEMICGKGGYVRAIARDLGETLGCFAHVVALRRIWSGPFDVRNGISLEDIEALAGTPDIDELLMPLECGLHNLPELTCDAAAAARLRNGNPALVLSSNAEYGDQAWASHQGTPVAVGIYRSGELHPHRVFNL